MLSGFYNASDAANISSQKAKALAHSRGGSVLIGFLVGLFVGTCIGVIAAALFGLVDI